MSSIPIYSNGTSMSGYECKGTLVMASWLTIGQDLPKCRANRVGPLSGQVFCCPPMCKAIGLSPLENSFPVDFWYQQLANILSCLRLTLHNLSLIDAKCGYACMASGRTNWLSIFITWSKANRRPGEGVEGPVTQITWPTSMSRHSQWKCLGCLHLQQSCPSVWGSPCGSRAGLEWGAREGRVGVWCGPGVAGIGRALPPCGGPRDDPRRGRLWPPGLAVGDTVPTLKSPSGAPPQTVPQGYCTLLNARFNAF